METTYTIGLDFGTNSVRALIVDTKDGNEIASSVWNYAHGEAGVVIDPKDPNLARQHPQDYIDGIRESIRGAMQAASKNNDFSAGRHLVGVGSAQDQRAKAPHLLVQEAHGVVLLVVGAQRVRADKLGERCRLVCRGGALRPHLMQHDRNAASGELPGSLAACKAAADDVHGAGALVGHGRKLGAHGPE